METKGIKGMVVGVVFAIISLVLMLTIVGSTSMITLINDALEGICNSGWPLASLFNPVGGIVPLLIVVGLFIASIVGAFAIGSAYKSK